MSFNFHEIATGQDNKLMINMNRAIRGQKQVQTCREQVRTHCKQVRTSTACPNVQCTIVVIKRAYLSYSLVPWMGRTRKQKDKLSITKEWWLSADYKVFCNYQGSIL